jgi:hypothetical protein
MAMGILVWSAQVKDFSGESSFWVTGKRRVLGLGFMGLGHSVPNRHNGVCPLDSIRTLKGKLFLTG